MRFTPSMKLEAAERELKYRRRVYPRLILAGKITQKFADEQIAVMAAIADDYRQPAAADHGPLFTKEA